MSSSAHSPDRAPGGDDFTDRNTSPNAVDIVLGVVLIALILEAMRRTSGWIMPAVGVAFDDARVEGFEPQPHDRRLRAVVTPQAAWWAG